METLDIFLLTVLIILCFACVLMCCCRRYKRCCCVCPVVSGTAATTATPFIFNDFDLKFLRVKFEDNFAGAPAEYSLAPYSDTVHLDDLVSPTALIGGNQVTTFVNVISPDLPIPCDKVSLSLLPTVAGFGGEPAMYIFSDSATGRSFFVILYKNTGTSAFDFATTANNATLERRFTVVPLATGETLTQNANDPGGLLPGSLEDKMAVVSFDKDPVIDIGLQSDPTNVDFGFLTKTAQTFDDGTTTAVINFDYVIQELPLNFSADVVVLSRYAPTAS